MSEVVVEDDLVVVVDVVVPGVLISAGLVGYVGIALNRVVRENTIVPAMAV